MTLLPGSGNSEGHGALVRMSPPLGPMVSLISKFIMIVSTRMCYDCQCTRNRYYFNVDGAPSARSSGCITLFQPAFYSYSLLLLLLPTTTTTTILRLLLTTTT